MNMTSLEAETISREMKADGHNWEPAEVEPRMNRIIAKFRTQFPWVVKYTDKELLNLLGELATRRR